MKRRTKILHYAALAANEAVLLQAAALRGSHWRRAGAHAEGTSEGVQHGREDSTEPHDL